MKVKDLIEQLSKFDPETEVIGSVIDHTDYRYTIPIEDVTLDSPYDDNGFSGVDGSEMDDNVEYWSESEDSLEYIGPKVVIIDLGNI